MSWLPLRYGMAVVGPPARSIALASLVNAIEVVPLDRLGRQAKDEVNPIRASAMTLASSKQQRTPFCCGHAFFKRTYVCR